MSRVARLRAGTILAAGVSALSVAACGAGVATQPRAAPVHGPPGSGPVAAGTTPIDRMATLARRRYADEVHGSEVHRQLRRIARDPALGAALQSGNVATLRAYVRGKFERVWYHWHVSRLRILRGSHVLVDVGVPWVVEPSQLALRDAHGHMLATLQVSIQDVIGFVRYLHRNFALDVVVRGRGAAHVRTSLQAARHAHLPDSGATTVAGRRYDVRSFRETSFGGEPIKVWILERV